MEQIHVYYKYCLCVGLGFTIYISNKLIYLFETQKIYTLPYTLPSLLIKCYGNVNGNE